MCSCVPGLAVLALSLFLSYTDVSSCGKCMSSAACFGTGAVCRGGCRYLLAVCDSELFPWPAAPRCGTASTALAFAPAIDLQCSNPSGFVLVSCDNCSEIGLSRSQVWDPGPGRAGEVANHGGEIPPQLAASLNSSGEADGNRAKWLRLFSFLRNSKAWFEGQSWLLDGCSEPVFKSTPPCRSAVGHQGQAQAVVPLWSNCCSLVGQQPRRFQTRACTCGASWGFWWGP